MIAEFREDHAEDEVAGRDPTCWSCERPFTEQDQGFYSIARVDEPRALEEVCESCFTQLVDSGEVLSMERWMNKQ